jgi:hypothetical protein
MDLDAVADELYGLSLDDFIPTRTAREKQVKGAGNMELAAEIHRLPKPNAVAWLVNQLARQSSDDIQTLLELGSEMREATANLSGDRLRELSRQQRQVIGGLVQQAERLAMAAGRPASAGTARSLEETFHAALADPGAADTVALGRLTGGLRSTGFAGLESSGGKQPPSSTPSSGGREPSRTKEQRGVEQRERAEARVTQAKSVAEEAARDCQEELARLQQAEQSVTDASDRVEQLRRELREAVKAQSKSATDRRRIQASFDRADRRAQDAQQRLAHAAAEQERPAP